MVSTRAMAIVPHTQTSVTTPPATEPTQLSDLPPELLHQALQGVAWYMARADGSGIALPELATVARCFYLALKTGPMAIQFSCLKLQETAGEGSISWSSLLGGLKSPIGALAFLKSNIRADQLAPLLETSACASLQLVPLRLQPSTASHATLACR